MAEADLIGCPIRLIMSAKTKAEGAVELKHRHQAESQLVKLSDLTDYILKQ
jgi:prolyl-tRNA synthetase